MSDDDDGEDPTVSMNDAMPIDYKVSPILPTAEQLTFRNEHASELVGKTILFNWAGVGWCKGTIHSTNSDGRKKINGKAANFLVTYEVDWQYGYPQPQAREPHGEPHNERVPLLEAFLLFPFRVRGHAIDALLHISPS